MKCELRELRKNVINPDDELKNGNYTWGSTKTGQFSIFTNNVQRYHKKIDDDKTINKEWDRQLSLQIQKRGHFMIRSWSNKFILNFFGKCAGEQHIIIEDTAKAKLLLNICDKYSEELLYMNANDLKLLTSFETEEELDAYFIAIQLIK